MLANKLNIGDTIGIISPSAPIIEDLKEQFSKGLQVFRNMGFKVKLSKNVYANTLGYSATVDVCGYRSKSNNMFTGWTKF